MFQSNISPPSSGLKNNTCKNTSVKEGGMPRRYIPEYSTLQKLFVFFQNWYDYSGDYLMHVYELSLLTSDVDNLIHKDTCTEWWTPFINSV
jgi:hypothetical protein